MKMCVLYSVYYKCSSPYLMGTDIASQYRTEFWQQSSEQNCCLIVLIAENWTRFGGQNYCYPVLNRIALSGNWTKLNAQNRCNAELNRIVALALNRMVASQCKNKMVASQCLTGFPHKSWTEWLPVTAEQKGGRQLNGNVASLHQTE